MKRKKFIKELLAMGYSRNRANEISRAVVRTNLSYDCGLGMAVVAWAFRNEYKEVQNENQTMD